ncbi:MAG: DUF2127 domain-containing protein [Opitutales bacterium]
MIRKPLLTGVRAVAIVEGAKAAIVLLAGFGLLALIHRDVQEVAEKIVRHSHLDPASKYPRIFLDAADRVTDTQLWLFAGLAALYALVRSVEAYGLWNERRWAEWFALASSAIYLPVEIYELWHRFGWIKFCVSITNIIVVAYMAYALRHSAEQDRELAESKLAPPPQAP